MTTEEYEQLLDACGGQYELLPHAQREAMLKEWRQVYAAGLHAATGRWKLPRYEWHVFSFQHAQALNGEQALAAYLAERPPAVVIHVDAARLPAVRLVGGELPDFRPQRLDALVWPEDLGWTMAFTHEESLGLGPYFSRREWLGPGVERS